MRPLQRLWILCGPGEEKKNLPVYKFCTSSELLNLKESLATIGFVSNMFERQMHTFHFHYLSEMKDKQKSNVTRI